MVLNKMLLVSLVEEKEGLTDSSGESNCMCLEKKQTCRAETVLYHPQEHDFTLCQVQTYRSVLFRLSPLLSISQLVYQCQVDLIATETLQIASRPNKNL